MAWSSIRNMRILLILIVLKNKFGLIYYVFYRIIVLIFCLCMNLYKGRVICSSISKGKKNRGNLLSRSLLLVFSGLPPFISFLLKLYFLGGLYSYDCLMLILDLLHLIGEIQSQNNYRKHIPTIKMQFEYRELGFQIHN